MEIHFLQPDERLILQTSVKDYVRNIVNSEMFWQDLCRNMRINNLISSELNEKIPHQVRQNVNEQVPRQVRDYLNHRLDNLVSRELMKQLPGVVSNNYQMQKLLDNHANEMKNYLQGIVREEVDKIVNEDQYHIINQRYFNAFNDKGAQRLAAFDRLGNQKITNLEDRYEKDMGNLETELNQISTIRDKLTELSDQIWWIKASAGTICSSLIIFLLLKN